jgi:hypothetical protein
VNRKPKTIMKEHPRPNTGLKTAVVGPHAKAERQLLGSYFSVACPLPAECPKVTKGCPHGSANAPCAGGDNSPGRVCHYVQTSTERAHRHIRSQLLLSAFR